MVEEDSNNDVSVRRPQLPVASAWLILKFCCSSVGAFVDPLWICDHASMRMSRSMAELVALDMLRFHFPGQNAAACCKGWLSAYRIRIDLQNASVLSSSGSLGQWSCSEMASH